jgi:hypothetical protein
MDNILFLIRRYKLMLGKWIILGLCLTVSSAFSQQSDRMELGRLQSGGTVSFVRTEGGQWGIEISGGNTLKMIQQKPAQIELYRGQENLRQLANGYQSVEKQAQAVLATAKIAGEGAASFVVEDLWNVSDAELSLYRNVKVTGTEPNAGFYSSIRLSTTSSIKWEDVNCLIPGLLYGQFGGRFNYSSKRFTIREDNLSAPLFAIWFPDGNWAAVLNPSPRGDTTQAETTAGSATPIIDEQIQFGALGSSEISEGGVDLGFWLPGTTIESGGGFGARRGGTAASPTVQRRYHPVKAGFVQTYQVRFRLGRSDSFREMERETWRWAWDSLKPKATPVDVEVMRYALADHLADRVVVVDDRAGIPFVIDAVSDKPGSFRPGGRQREQPNNEVADWANKHGIEADSSADELALWPKIILGFCGKNVEVADQLLIESDRDSGPRGERLRKLGLTIIESLIRIVPMSPVPVGEGFDIRTGEVSGARGGTGFSLRSVSEDMRIAVDMYRREKARGREHANWIKWVTDYADFIVKHQREDGSFPSSFQGGTGQPTSNSGVTTYAAVPVLTRIYEESRDKKYLDSAIRAANYLWDNFGSKCVYEGATGGSAVDKESGMLSLEAFLSLYETTKEAGWLDHAKSAADYTESWIWIWNVPMPIGANYADLGWKPGVPTVGANGIASNVPGEVDQYLDWSVPSYAKLYKYTNEEHYLDVARILLHGTKAMLALPGRTYDLKSPGWQQEHWRMGGRGTRGIGAHRTWLPWISVNHLHGITGLEDFDKELYKQLSKGD